jgi:hypothetical protein
MTSDYGPSVTRRHGYDYWRTWFLDECEAASLLGVTAEQLPLITKSGAGRSPYRPGTELFLEDAPWFPHSGGKTHRISGPYVVKATDTLPDHAELIHEVDGQIVVYRDFQPERGPWHNRSMAQRLVDGEIVVARQIAGQFDHFPYRTRIVRTPRWHIELIRHSDNCWLC